MKFNLSIFAIFLSFISIHAWAAEPLRFSYTSSDPSIPLEGFIYEPVDPTNARGVVLVIGGSGFTKGGFGGPSKFARALSDQGYIAFEWNKRGIVSNADLTDTQKDFAIYNTATLDNILLDAEASFALLRNSYPGKDLYVIGGSEGSIVTTHLAEKFDSQIRAVAVFGVVVTHFVQVVEKQITDLVLEKYWNDYDQDQDNFLSPSEFSAIPRDHEDWGYLANMGFSSIDVSRDQKISRDEAAKATMQFYLLDKNNRDEYWLESSGIASGYFESIFSVAPLTIRSENINIPVHVLQGEDDWNTPAKYVYQLENVTKIRQQNNFTYKYYAGVGHSPSGEMLQDILQYFSQY